MTRTPERHAGYCTPWTACCRVVESSTVDPAVVAAVERAAATASAALGATVSRVAYFCQTVFHGSFRTVDGRPCVWFDNAVRGASDSVTGEIWLNAALDPDEAAKIAYHEVAHLAGANEREATRYADEASSLAVAIGDPLPKLRGSFWQQPTNYAADLPATEIPIQEPGYYGISLYLEWDSFTGGGTVQVVRVRGGVDTVVWEWAATNGKRGEGVAAPIPCLPGDQIRIDVDHGDASAQDLAYADLTIWLIDRIDDPEWELVFEVDNYGVTHDGTNLWTTDDTDDVDPALFQREIDGTVVNSYSGYDAPVDSAPARNRSIVYAASFLWGVGNLAEVSKIDPSDGSVVSTFDAGEVDNLGSHTGIGHDGTNLFVVEQQTDEIREFNTSGTLQATHSFPTSREIVDLTWDGVHWWATTTTKTIVRMDSSFNETHEFAGPTETNQGIHWRHGFLYVMTPTGLYRRPV